MTPLAHAITKELLLPVAKRSFRDQCGLLDLMDDIHCFECSAVTGLATEMSTFVSDWLPDETEEERNLRATSRFNKMAAVTSFLPAPKTWLEWMRGDIRVGLLLVEREGWAEMRAAFSRGNIWGSVETAPAFGLKELAGQLRVRSSADVAVATNDAIYAQILLALINSPRVVGRETHEPHRGLQRAVRARGAQHPLHAWTEIRLEVGAPDADRTGETTTLTGQKALHFCRAHFRLRMGHVEIVKAHWRGDETLGLKQARYTVVPPSRAA
jgi:hypothetical protein